MGESQSLNESREEAVRTELNALLESAAFRTSKRCREFLAHIVEQTVSGQSGMLKERSIGADLFQLPHDYDTGQHTIVRVTASEVRKKLAQHYMAENGEYHAMRIELPPGSYSAHFKWSAPVMEAPLAEAAVELPAAMPAKPEALRRRWFMGRTLVSVTVVAALGSGVVLRHWLMAKPVSVNAKTVHLGTPSRAAAGVTAESGELRMIAGSTAPYTDRSGRTWEQERFFSGGTVLVRPGERILRTLDPDIYRHMRNGDFRYDIPLDPGTYEVHLHFAETELADFISAESSGEGQRLFGVTINGKRVLEEFDVVADADGADVSDERVFRDISPAQDGFLHLNFASMRGAAMLSGVEVLPVRAGAVRPIRIRAGWTASWQDSEGRQWGGDTYFLGGNALLRKTNPVREGSGMTPDTALYASERWGHFSYSIPVPEGRYKVRLKFCEAHYGRHNVGVGGVGSRVFDVYCNGVALLKDFDIFKQAGGEGKPIERAFSEVRPTAQGKINLTFVPVEGMACVNGIEVEEDR